MVKNLPCNAGDTGLNPGQETKIPHATGQLSLLCHNFLRCDRKVGNPFQTKQGSRPSCPDQEGRRGSEEAKEKKKMEGEKKKKTPKGAQGSC